MPADEKNKEAKLESRPLKAISMPEYRYQDYVVSEHFSSLRPPRVEQKEQKIDLSGLSLNLS